MKKGAKITKNHKNRAKTNQPSTISILLKNPVFTVLAFTAIFITSILLLAAFNIKSTGELEILVAPSSATVTINNKTYQNGTFRFPIGTYDISVEKEGFESKSFTVEIQEGNTSKLSTYLMQTDGSYSWYEKHQEDALILDTIGGREAQKTEQSFLEQYPIIKVLPLIYANYDKQYNYTEYRIDGGKFDDCPSDFCLQISDTTGGNKEAALQLIKNSGFDPSDYTILYKETPIKPLNK